MNEAGDPARRWIRIARSAIAGLVAGTLVLGVGGRLLMRLLALLAEHSPGFSLGGSLEVVATGSIYGTLGGLVRLLPVTRWSAWRAVLVATFLFVLVILTSAPAREAASTIPGPLRIIAGGLFAILLLGYAITQEEIASRLDRKGRPPSDAVS